MLKKSEGVTWLMFSTVEDAITLLTRSSWLLRLLVASESDTPPHPASAKLEKRQSADMIIFFIIPPKSSVCQSQTFILNS